MPGDLTWLFDRIAGLQWWALTAALVCHASAVSLHVLAWRTILAHEYGTRNVRFSRVFSGYVAGSAVNAFVPGRAGVVLKLFIVKNHIRGASYSALAATLGVLAAFDAIVTTAIAAWAIEASLLPNVTDLADDRGFIGGVVLDHTYAATAGFALAAAVLIAVGVAFHRRLRGLRLELARGLRVLARPRFYLFRVLPVQVVNWAVQLMAIAFFLMAFNLPSTIGNVLLVQAAKSLAVLFPFTPSGAGAQFALLMLAFNRRFSALTVGGLAIGMRVTTTAFNVAVGSAAILQILGTLRWRRVMNAEAALHPRPSVGKVGDDPESGYAASNPIPSATTPAPRQTAPA
jgi:uncharacterized membrane protein YbhN (UPF0104 family)